MEKWIRVFYATVWVDPAHDFFQFRFEGETYRIFSHEIRALYEKKLELPMCLSLSGLRLQRHSQ
jgi:hypothetical protein